MNKLFLRALICGATTLLACSVSQNINNSASLESSPKFIPFTVVYAENVKKVGSLDTLGTLEDLGSEIILNLNDSSHLILGHYSGLLIEFNQDTLIDINELSALVNRQLDIESNEGSKRAIYNLLYSNNSSLSTKRRQGVVHRCFEGNITYKFPAITQSYQVGIPKSSPKICLEWVTQEKHKELNITLEVRSIFNELIDSYKVSDTSGLLDLSNYESESNLYVIELKDTTNELFSIPIGIQLDSGIEYIPSNCDINTSIEALQTAYYLESHQFYYDAGDYYELAADLSNKKFYKLMLENYRNRQ